MKKYNVVWILVDSVRTYYSTDDRSRIEIMDKFSKECIEFTNVITSAPSTVMSVSSMMTSIPAFYLGRNYNDFRFDRNYFPSLTSILNNTGWESKAIVMVPEIREKLTVLDLLEKKYWPKGYSHKDDWNNKDIFNILQNALKSGNSSKEKKPIFWFLDFNCRQDKNTSKIVEETIDILERNDYNKENTIFVLCSDHGYPDPSSGITPEILKKKKLTHDMFMTDDNIMIPLIFSYPGCQKNLKISNLSSSLDIMPTILDLLGINISDQIKNQWFGKSLLENLKKDQSENLNINRNIRVDARFLGQDRRVTAVRNNQNKLLYFHDKKKYELFVVGKSHLDEKQIDINNNLKIFNELKKEFKRSEISALKFQVDYSIHKLKNELKILKNVKKILILYNNKSMSDILRETLEELYKDIEISNMYINNFKKNVDEKYDILFVFDDVLNKDRIKLIKKIKFKKKFYIDINMNLSIKTGNIIRYLKTIYYNRRFYYQEPSLVFWKIKQIIKTIFKKN